RLDVARARQLDECPKRIVFDLDALPRGGVFLPDIVHQQGGEEAEQDGDRGEIRRDQASRPLQGRRDRPALFQRQDHQRGRGRSDQRENDLPARGGRPPHQPPNISFTLLKKPSASGLVLPAFSNSLRSSFCRAVRLVGVSTTISMYMSPRWLERTIGMPLPRRRN